MQNAAMPTGLPPGANVYEQNGKQYTANDRAASELYQSATAISNAADTVQGPNFDINSSLYEAAVAGRNTLRSMAMEAKGSTNTVGFNAETSQLVDSAIRVYERNIQGAREGLGNTEDLDFAAEVVRNLITPQTAPTTPPPMAAAGGVDGAAQALQSFGRATTVSDQIAVLLQAVAMMLQTLQGSLSGQMMGGTAPGALTAGGGATPPPTPTAGPMTPPATGPMAPPPAMASLPPAALEEGDTMPGGAIAAPSGDAIMKAAQSTIAAIEDVVAPAEAKAEAKPETKTLAGDDLMGKLDANGGALTFDEKSGGIAVRTLDEAKEGETAEPAGDGGLIEGDEKITFRPGGTVDGAEVTISSLRADEDGKAQEKASIDVVKDGKVVDTIQINGDLDGEQSVEIDRSFDELVFRAEGDADFAVNEITTKTMPEAPEAPGGPDELPPVSTIEEAQEQNLSLVMELLQNILATVQAVEASDVPEGDAALVMDIAGQLVGLIAKALDDGSVGSAEADSFSTLVEALVGMAGAALLADAQAA